MAGGREREEGEESGSRGTYVLFGVTQSSTVQGGQAGRGRIGWKKECAAEPFAARTSGGWGDGRGWGAFRGEGWVGGSAAGERGGGSAGIAARRDRCGRRDD